MADEALYDDVADAYHRWSSRGHPDLADDSFAELVGDVVRQRVCAVACGSGREARFLARRGAIVTGVDISSNLLDIARQLDPDSPFPITWVQDNAHDLGSLPDGAYDGVVCYMALMDIKHLDRSLRAITRILVPGGWFVFVITHPCFKTPAYGEVVDHVTGSVRRTVGKYFDEGAWDGPGWDTDHLPSRAYHRTLSTYVNAVVHAGFIIERMLEPKLDTPVWHEAACLLYVRCRKA